MSTSQLAAHSTDSDGRPLDKEALRKHIADEFMAKRMALAKVEEPVLQPAQVASLVTDLSMLAYGSATVAPTGNGQLMQASFGAFRPNVRIYNDASYFYVESDSMPDAALMPTPMVGITSWQQQLPHPVGYFSHITNPETDTGSLGYGQPNVWKIPLVPLPAASPISLTGNFLRGAVALGVNGIPIFNPRNNTGQFSQAIGELDAYGGHCGRADDYHYHIAPTHLYSVLPPDKPCAWALDGYPIYGYVEPDGSAMQALDADGGHTHGTWGYHYHARGTFNSGTGTWTPANPYLMNAMHGSVVNYGGQIDPQPTASTVAPAGSPLSGAVITSFTRNGDAWTMTYTVSGTTYTVTASVNRIAHTVTVSQQSPSDPTGTPATYTSANRFNYYPVAPWSMNKLPDTGQTTNATATFGEDSDYTRYAPSFTDNGNGTITDNNSGLMWQKTDSGEMTWDNARTGASTLNLAGYTDWRLPTAQEAFAILDHERNPALNPTYFVNNAGGTPGYFWTSDLFYGDNTKVWCTNAGGGLGPHNKTATISAGGTNRHHARYVRGAKPTVGHRYINNNDNTVTDLDTGLMWTQAPATARSWNDALIYAEGLSLAGFSDWRLPNIKELQSLQDIPRATSAAVTTNPCINRLLFPSATATAYWSSTSVKSGTPTQAWLVDFGVTTTSTPSRNQQGIVSYEPYASTYPVFAVRTASVPRSITQGIATTTTANLLPAGQRVSAVGSITATDGSVWTVPSATQFSTATKAPDLYNEVNAVTPANIAAASAAIASAPTVVVDADGEVITGYIFADNYFELYVNGVRVGVDAVPFTPFNSSFVKFKAKRPITYAVKLVDWEENLGIGSELNGGDPYHPGDGGFCASFSDGTVTNGNWKAQSFYIAPLNDPALVVEQADGRHDSSAAGLQTPTLNQNSYALHYDVPADWASKSFNDSGWPSASTYTEAQVGVNNKPAYTNFSAQFGGSGAQFIWSSNIVLDNEVIVRFTGPATAPQLAVEQPSGTALTDGSSAVSYGNVSSGTTSSKTFTLRNNGSTTLTINGVTIDGTNANQFSITTSPASSIAAGGSTTLVVQFAPTSTGAKSAALHITSSDTTYSAAFDINLDGTGASALVGKNILLIIADDMGTDALSLYNTSPTAQLAPVPNISTLASNGVRFTNAYAYTVCSPTRSSILTGRFGSRTGTANVVGGASSNNALKASEFTLPEAFAANSALDYQLKHIGKWHLGGTNTAPCLIGGWPAYVGSLGPEVTDFYNWTKVTGSGSTASSATSTTYATTDNVNDALAFISAQTAANKKWFTWLAFNAPHDPYHKPPDALHTYDTTVANWASLSTTGNELVHYNAAIQAMDTEIGRLLAGVDLNTTTVIFIGDNGTPPTTLQAPFPANRGKSSLYEGGIRVPMIVRSPDVVSPGRTSSQLVHVTDLYSTILEIAGINVAATVPSGTVLDSQSVLPVLLNQSGTRTRVFDDYFDLAFPTLTESGRTLRDGQYKLTRLKNGTDRFHDLSADPYEATNLVGSMNATQTTAYNSLVTQLADFNTAPTISTIANQSTVPGVATTALAFTVGDAELNTAILSVTAASSNTTLVPTANIVLGGTNPSRTVTVTPAAGQSGSAVITLSVTDGIFTTSSSFTLAVGVPTAVGSIVVSPSTPTNTDAGVITVPITPATGTTISSVQLQYSTGAQTTSTVWRETFSHGSTASGLAGALNAWTTTNVRNATDVKQRSSTGNRTTPITLTNCTTNGTTAVTCDSTANLWPGMAITGTNIAGSTTISQINSATSITLSTAATGSGSGLTLTAAGMALSGCSLGTSPTINTATTTGLAVGMGIAGAGLTVNPPNPIVNAITNGTSFTVNSTVTAVPATLTASGCGLEFAVGNANYTDTMATITNAINAGTASAGSIDFYVRNADMVSNNGWTFQVSPDGGTTWNTRLSESYANTTAANCSLNATTTVTCADTSKLTVGNIVQGAAISVASCTTSNVTNPTVVLTANTTNLLVGMFVSGTGIPNNSRITAISPGVSFTMNNSATAAGTVTVLANYFNANITITAINPNVSFTVSTAPFVTATGVTLASINHGFQLKHYDFTAGELTSNLKFRFQWSGSQATAPARNPVCDIDDISVTLTTGAAPQTLTMTPDGNGNYTATIPVQTAGTTVSYTIIATDSASGTASSSGSYIVGTAAPVLAVTPTSTLSASGAVASGTYSPSSLTYTLSNTGTGTMSWTAGKTQSWLNLSATSGTLAAGATTIVTASINATNANSLATGTYSDTITFTNGYNGSGNTTRAASLLITTGTPTAPNAPVLASLAAFSSGSSKTVFWPAVGNATGYSIQIATDAAFTQNVVAQTVTGTSATFDLLTHGVTYYYRVLATNSIGSSAYSNVVSSTQDQIAPVVAITSPVSGGSQSATTITVSGTASDALSGISAVKVNNVAATVSGGTWSATIPLGFGTNAITATAFDGAGNLKTSSAVLVTMTTSQTYNPLIIPDMLTGSTLNLELNQTTKQFAALGPKTPTVLGSATTTLGYNGALMWGPTLIMNKGDYVQLNVKNNLDQSTSTVLRETTTTVHWHGLHIPAIMDGGPRQVIPAGTTWSPSFEVMNDAATYWYHPHLHVATQEQLTLGAGGFIIIRDPQEAPLGLPRTYGVDDIPLALTSRRFLNPTNQFSFNQYAENTGTTSSLDNYGDYILINGTLNPQVSLPKQYVRLRILNAEIQRGYNLGFSDNRTFYVIGNDQGLLAAPVPVTRMFLMVGERVEILVNLSADTAAFDLMAYNSGQVFGFPSQEGPAGGTTTTGNAGPENGSRLNNQDFALLRINPVAQTSGAVTTLPATLVSQTYWTAANATNTRTIAVTGGQPSTVNGITTSTGFTFNNISYSPSVMNHTIPLNAIERWNISGGNIFGHSLHIHDIKFNILARYIGTTATPGTQVTTNGLAAPYESGWKDTVYIPRGESVSLLMKFDDFASNENPYMFHCHFMNHEDGGMMGQFLVVNNAVEDLAVASFTRYGSNNQIDLDFKATPGTTYTLQYSTDMSTWTTIGSVTSDGNSAGFTETDPTRLGQAKGFYRVVLPTAPNAPAITSPTTATGTVGTAFSYQITATNNPTSFIVIGLPAGLSYNKTTGLISGTLTAAGTNNVTFVATNDGGTAEGHFVITVN